VGAVLARRARRIYESKNHTSTIEHHNFDFVINMSSTLGAMLNSDAPSAASRKQAPRTPNRRTAQRSSPRPPGPPSESNGALSDGEGFPDDEVVGVRGTDRNRPRDPMAQAVPRVVDRVGEKVAEEFEKFLDQ